MSVAQAWRRHVDNLCMGRCGTARARWRVRLPARLRTFTPMAWQSIALAVVCPLLIQGLIRSSAFAPDRVTLMNACCVVFVVFGIDAVVRGRVTGISFWAQCLEAFVMVVLIGSSTTSLGVIAACVSAVPLVLIDAAAVRSLLETVLLVPLGAVALGIMLHTQGVGGAALVLSCCAIALLAGGAALVVFAFRARAEGAAATAERLARTDPLTGLLNRHGLATTAPDLLRRARSEGRPLGVLLIDVDHFKLVNDVHGHAAGDRVLRRLAEVVGGACSRGEVVARIGGEEICVLLVCESDTHLRILAERVRARTEVAGTTPAVTVSIGGLSERVDDAMDLTVLATCEELVMRLVDRADSALYEVKRNGRNAVRLIDPAVLAPVASGELRRLPQPR